MDDKNTGISFQDAMKIMGFKTRPSQREVEVRFKDLAKKYHPDIHKDIESAIKFKELGEAKGVLIKREPLSENIDWKKYYPMLKKVINKDTPADKIPQIYARELQNPKFRNNPIEEQKLAASFNRLSNQINAYKEFEDFSARKTGSILRSRARMAGLDDFSREAIALQERARSMILLNSIDKLLMGLPQLLSRSKYIKNKPSIPIIVKEKGKRPYVKFILLTASLIVAVLGGKYAYDKALNAYYRKNRVIMVRN